MVDIVYVLGPGSKWQDNEIKYSVRSVLKHAKNYGTIWIVGNAPRCELDAPTRFVPRTHRQIVGHANVRASLKEIALTQDCSERFIFMNDDFFLTQDMDMDTIPNYSCGVLGARSTNYLKSSPGYWRTICYTWAVLSALAYPTRDYEVHGPMLMEKSKVILALNLEGTESTTQIRSVYGNLHGGVVKTISDCKIGLKKDPEFTKEKALKIIEGRPFFSIGDELSDEVKTIFEDLYPKVTDKVYPTSPYQPALDKALEEFCYMI